MRIDISKPILDLDGQPVRDVLGQDANGPVFGAVLDIRKVIVGTCLHPLPEDGQTPGQAEKAFQVALACSGILKIVDLTAEDVAFIKARLPKRWGPLIVGRTVQALDTEVGVVVAKPDVGVDVDADD